VLSLKEAAERLGVSQTVMRELVDRRQIRHFQLKKWSAIKFEEAWIDQFIEAHTVEVEPVGCHRSPSAPPAVKRPVVPSGPAVAGPDEFGLDYNLAKT